MNTLNNQSGAEFQCGLMPAMAGIAPKPKLYRECGRAMMQRGVVLFFTLIALVVMSLAAVALIRSVDTSNIIAGNLAFKQAGTSSGDAGIEAAIAWLSAAQSTMQAGGLSVYQNTTHVFNITGGAPGYTVVNPSGPTAGPAANGATCCQSSGYYSNFDPNVTLTDSNPPITCNSQLSNSPCGLNWNSSSVLVQVDSSGNTIDSSGNSVRYVIQRMCRTANEIPDTNEQPLLVPPKTGCLFSSAALNNNAMNVLDATQVCQGAGCSSGGSTVLFRITAQVTGPKNTVSYIQTVVY
jgi:type IV pilus assembly protein PilX